MLKFTPSSRPLLLLLDGHSSHYEPETPKFTKENDIMFFLPPHTTHESQPLDVGVLGLSTVPTECWSADKVALFECRLEEGYNLPDPEYLSWLEVNHPELVPTDWYSLTSAGESVADAFVLVLPATPITTADTTTTAPLLGADGSIPSQTLSTPTSSGADGSGRILTPSHPLSSVAGCLVPSQTSNPPSTVAGYLLPSQW